MTSDIIVADSLAESSLTVADCVLVDDAELVTDDLDDQPATTLSEWSA